MKRVASAPHTLTQKWYLWCQYTIAALFDASLRTTMNMYTLCELQVLVYAIHTNTAKLVTDLLLLHKNNLVNQPYKIWLVLTPQVGLEPTTFGLEVQRAIHCATRAIILPSTNHYHIWNVLPLHLTHSHKSNTCDANIPLPQCLMHHCVQQWICIHLVSCRYWYMLSTPISQN